MGVVLIAQERNGSTKYAIKTCQDWCFRTPGMAERFRREVEAWVRLGRHPNIVAAEHVEILDGRPYVVLEYVGPETLRQVVERGRLPVEQAVSSVFQIGQALAHARRTLRHFSHRDIKPENCLIPCEGTLKLTDFGLVKSWVDKHDGVQVPRLGLTGTMYSQALQTEDGRFVVGTLPYMAPEQILSFAAADVRSDFYSMGVVLYELVTGRRPFVASAPEALIDCVLHEPPMDPRELKPNIPDEIAEITLRWLGKNPRNRRGKEMMLRLREWLRLSDARMGEPKVDRRGDTEADPISDPLARCFQHEYDPMFDAGTWARWSRHDAIVGFEVFDEEEELKLEQSEAKARAWQWMTSLRERYANLPPNAKRAKFLRTLGHPNEASSLLEDAISQEPWNWAAWFEYGDALVELGKLRNALDCYDQVDAHAGHLPGVREERSRALARLGALTSPVEFPAGAAILQSRPIDSVVFSPDGRRTAMAGSQGVASVRKARSQRGLTGIPSNGEEIRCVAFNPDGRLLAFGGRDGRVRVSDANLNDEPLEVCRHDGEVRSLAFTPDGGTLVSAGDDKNIQLSDSTTGEPRAIHRAHTDRVTAVAVDPSGGRIASGSTDRTVKLWDSGSGTAIITLFQDEVWSVAFSPDGRWLAAANGNHAISIWDMEIEIVGPDQSGRLLRVLTEHRGPVTSLACSIDGKWLVSGSCDRCVKAWRTDTWDSQWSFRDHGAEVTCVALSPDGTQLASADRDGKLKVRRFPPKAH